MVQLGAGPPVDVLPDTSHTQVVGHDPEGPP
jgi:hypothetical protein